MIMGMNEIKGKAINRKRPHKAFLTDVSIIIRKKKYSFFRLLLLPLTRETFADQ